MERWDSNLPSTRLLTALCNLESTILTLPQCTETVKKFWEKLFQGFFFFFFFFFQKRHDRSEFFIATKVGRYGRDDFDFSPENVIKSVEKSLELLQIDYFDVLQIHDCEFHDLSYIAEKTIPAVFELKKQKKVQYIGVTGLPLRMLSRLLSLITDEKKKIDLVLSYCHHTLFDDSLVSSGFLKELQKQGVAVINASALSMSLLCESKVPVIIFFFFF